MSANDGLISGYLLDGLGSGTEVDWDEIRSWQPKDGVLWIHLDRTVEESQRWLTDEAGLDPLVSGALLAEETRPRMTVTGDGVLLILRGVNLNPGADPEDMVSVRLWIDSRRIISLRRQRVMAIHDICEALKRGEGSKNAGDFLSVLCVRLMTRMGPVIEDLADAVDGLEDQLLHAQSHALRSQLASLRRQAIALHRYMGPQRKVLSELQNEAIPWLHETDRAHIAEAADRLSRHVESLDTTRNHAAVTHEELNVLLSERMNRTMYFLTLMAAIFMPPTLLTGLLGINVGGMPGADDPFAFWAVGLLLVVLVSFQVWLFRRMKWF